jgi:hypothetical protein
MLTIHRYITVLFALFACINFCLAVPTVVEERQFSVCMIINVSLGELSVKQLIYADVSL